MAEAFLQIAEPGASPTKAGLPGRARSASISGTTNSLVAIVDGGQARLPRATRTAQAILPSVVHYAADGDDRRRRRGARSAGAGVPRDTIASVKRFMGRGPGDAEATRSLRPTTSRRAAGDGTWCASRSPAAAP